MGDYKQYIKTKVVGTDTLVIDGYSDWQTDKYNPADIQISGTFGRQFQTQLTNQRSQFIYKLVNGSMVARTQAELDVEWNSRPPTPPNDNKRLADIESAILSLMGL